jgi:hypothetical protein
MASSFFSPIKTRMMICMLCVLFVHSGDSTCAWVPTRTSLGTVSARRGREVALRSARCCKDETSSELLRVVSKNQGILAINKRFGQRMDGETTQNRAYTQRVCN